jgi:endonuclease-8
MPEGHLVHRHAEELRRAFVGRVIEASSPQGRFADEATAIDGARLLGTETYGKHLFIEFDGERIVHVHLGRQGLWLRSDAAEAPRPSVRLRLAADGQAADLIAPLVCELGDGSRRDAVVARLGPDPLREDADLERVRTAIASSSQPIGALLLDQSVVSGVGNVLRAEILNLIGVHPATEGLAIEPAVFDSLWQTTEDVMQRAADEGRIITRRPPGVPVETLDEVEGRFVYKRDRCGRCDTELEHLEIAGRAINACPTCQPRIEVDPI